MNLSRFFLTLKGSFTSGNWGHRGNPPNHGGSSPGGGHSRIGLKPSDTQTDKNLKVHLTRMDRVPSKKVEKKPQPKKAEIKKEPEKKVEEKFGKAKEKELKELYKDYGKECLNLNDPGCVGLNRYTSSAYEKINESLRQGSKPSSEDKKTINAIDKAMNEAPRTEQNMIVHRSVASGILNNLIQKGVEFQDKGFVSTTIDKNQTMTTANLEIRIPKGSKGIYVAEISEYKSEKEFLLPRNSKFRVVEKTEDKAVLELITE